MILYLGKGRSGGESIRLIISELAGSYLIFMRLTNNAISAMFSQGGAKGCNFVVEALEVKVKPDYLRLDVKDAATTVKAVIYTTRPGLNILDVCSRIDDEDRYLIRITQFKTHTRNEKLMLEILDFSPVSMAPNAKIQQFAEQPTKKETSRDYQTEKKEPNTNTRRPIEPVSYERANRAEEEETMEDDVLKQYEKISDLYIGFQGKWEIVVRAIEKSYREFNNKSGKLTKIFSMTMVDRTGLKIEGVMFGDSAREYHELIQKNHIYRISRAQIREESYNQTKRKDYSKYNLILNRDTVFIPVKDISSIPRADNTDPTLQQIIAENDFQKAYSFSAILLAIGEERNIEKGDRTIYKKSLVVGDPETRKSIDVVVWNKDLYLNPMWIDKTILLKSFKLHNYRDTLSFSSNFRSEISHSEGHRFNSFEGTLPKEDYEPISEQREENNNNRAQDSKLSRSVREIEAEVMYSNSLQAVYSDLQVYITHMSFKNKWFYDACNKCKKTAQSGTKCMNCGHYNEVVQRRFIIPIELSDSTGSIWTTAFDEFSQEIFRGTNIQELSRLQEGKLKQEAECRLYQQFRLRISSKKEVEGNVKHSIVGKVSQVSVERASTSNVQKIKKAMF